jgi:hypothetical protein
MTTAVTLIVIVIVCAMPAAYVVMTVADTWAKDREARRELALRNVPKP